MKNVYSETPIWICVGNKYFVLKIKKNIGIASKYKMTYRLWKYLQNVGHTWQGSMLQHKKTTDKKSDSCICNRCNISWNNTTIQPHSLLTNEHFIRHLTSPNGGGRGGNEFGDKKTVTYFLWLQTGWWWWQIAYIVFTWTLNWGPDSMYKLEFIP